MSAGGSSGPPPGMIQNSVLNFVASAQDTLPQGNQPQGPNRISEDADRDTGHADRQMPAGLKALCEACTRLYPDQPNPLQVTTRLKYWLGGHDPLDYISMYWNPGIPAENVPPHWHYVSFGLSDLHGDSRVHGVPRGACSGFGLELTFRLAAPGAPPPLWPAALLQQLARYVFTTGNKFCPGDHISWHSPLDGQPSGSRVRHLLVAEDPKLKPIQTRYGSVDFIQIVGCTSKELRAAQRGSGFEVLKIMAEDRDCGGPWLVTCCGRVRSARGVRRGRTERAERAELAGVSAGVVWESYTPECQESKSPWLSARDEQQIKDALQRGLNAVGERSGPEGHNMSTDSFEMSSIERALPQVPDLQGSWREEETEYMDGVHLIMNAEAASLLPLAIDGRVRRGSHFTWRGRSGAATVAGCGVRGARACGAQPYVSTRGWLQIFIPNELAEDMSEKVARLATLCQSDSEPDSDDEGTNPNTESIGLPITFTWDKYALKITVVHDSELL